VSHQEFGCALFLSLLVVAYFIGLLIGWVATR